MLLLLLLLLLKMMMMMVMKEMRCTEGITGASGTKTNTHLSEDVPVLHTYKHEKINRAHTAIRTYIHL